MAASVTESKVDLKSESTPMDTETETKQEEKPVSLDDIPEGDLDLFIKEETKKDEKVKVSRRFASISKLIFTATESDKEATEVPVPLVKNFRILKMVADFMNHHEGKAPPIPEKPLKSKDMKDACEDKWDAEYIDKIGENRQDLYDLILAANYMEINSLLHIGCAKVASLIKGQPLEKIKEILSVGTTAAATSTTTAGSTTSESAGTTAATSTSTESKRTA